MNKALKIIITILVLALLGAFARGYFFPQEDSFSAFSLFQFFFGFISALIYNFIDEKD